MGFEAANADFGTSMPAHRALACANRLAALVNPRTERLRWRDASGFAASPISNLLLLRRAVTLTEKPDSCQDGVDGGGGLVPGALLCNASIRSILPSTTA